VVNRKLCAAKLIGPHDLGLKTAYTVHVGIRF